MIIKLSFDTTTNYIEAFDENDRVQAACSARTTAVAHDANMLTFGDKRSNFFIRAYMSELQEIFINGSSIVLPSTSNDLLSILHSLSVLI